MSTDPLPFAPLLGDVAGVAAALQSPAANDEEASDLALMLDAVRTWAGRHVDAAAIDAASAIPPALYQSAADLGLFGLMIPTEHGGAGFSLPAACRIIGEVAHADRSVATAVGLHCGLGSRGLIAMGAPDLQGRYLPQMATGRRIASFAATEPQAGSHIAGISTTARQHEGRLVLSGSKCFVTNGGIAGVFTVLARTPGLGGARRGASLLLVEREQPGVVVGAEEHKLGIRGSSTTTLSFDDVAVDLDHVVGPAGGGMQLFENVLSYGRTLMAAGCVGTAQTAYQLARDHAWTRRQFGRPIAAFGQSRYTLAAMHSRITAMDSAVQLTARLQQQGAEPGGWCSAATKVLASEGCWQVVDDALQLHGGTGFIEGSGIPRLLRDCRVTRIFEGANDVLRVSLAAACLGSTDARTPPPLLAPQVHPALRHAAHRFDQSLRHSLGAVQEVVGSHGLRAVEHQFVLSNVAAALIACYALLAVLLRLEGELATHPTTAQPPQAAQADFAANLWGGVAEDHLRRASLPDIERLAHTLSEAQRPEPTLVS